MSSPELNRERDSNPKLDRPTQPNLVEELDSFAEATLGRKLSRPKLLEKVPASLASEADKLKELGIYASAIREMIVACSCFDRPAAALRMMVEVAKSLGANTVNTQATSFALEFKKFRTANGETPLSADESSGLVRAQLTPRLALDEGQDAPRLGLRGGLTSRQREKRN